MISFPMYDWPELEKPHADFLESLRREFDTIGITLPARFTKDAEGISHWLDHNLVLSQTCGLPFMRFLKGKLLHLGSPSYHLKCEAGSYYSVIITRKNSGLSSLTELKEAKFGCNGLNSQSGYAVMQSYFLQNGEEVLQPETIAITGSHRQSVQALISGEIDYAAIDAVSWTLAKRYDPGLENIAIFDQTSARPSLPYITSFAYQDKSPQMAEAIKNSILSLENISREALLLTGFQTETEENYQIIKDEFDAIQRVLDSQRNAT